MRNRLVRSICTLLLCCAVAVLAVPSVAIAQRDIGFRVQFGPNQFRPDVERLLRQTENHTRQFAAMLEERDREGLSERARELQSQLDMVGGSFDERSNYSRRSQVASVLRVAQSLSNAMRVRRVGVAVQRQWLLVRSDLNRLARVYNLRTIY